MNQAQALYRLQSLELSLDEATERLNEIEAALQNSEILQSAKAALKERADELHTVQVTVTNFELELNSLVSKIAEGEELLYSGKISNPKELNERQAEQESLKRRQIKLEEDLATSRQQLEETSASHEEATHTLLLAEEESAQQNTEFLTERTALQEKMKGWLRDRKIVLERIDPAIHKIYKRLKTQRNGIAVARLDGETCSACMVEQTENIIRKARQSQELVYCHDCSRILVAL